MVTHKNEIGHTGPLRINIKKGNIRFLEIKKWMPISNNEKLMEEGDN